MEIGLYRCKSGTSSVSGWQFSFSLQILYSCYFGSLLNKGQEARGQLGGTKSGAVGGGAEIRVVEDPEDYQSVPLRSGMESIA